MKKVFIAIIICILSFSVANAGDYKYVRTYDANGNVVETANPNFDMYIWANCYESPGIGIFGSTPSLLWGIYTRFGGNWNLTPCPSYTYRGQDNGWYIFQCTIGFSTDYFFYKSDGSFVRTTFMAGGNGRFKEYEAATRPL